MSDITHNLLTQYYGVGVQTTGTKSLTLYECTYDSEDNTEDFPAKHSSIDPSEDNASKRTDDVEGNVDYEKRNSIYDKYVRSSRVLEIDLSDDEEKRSKSLEGFLEPSIEYDHFESPKLLSVKDSSPDKTLLDPTEHGATLSPTLNVAEEVLQDNVSDISSVVSKKKTRKFAKAFTISLPPPPKKAPVCNGTLMDMTNVGLRDFPVEVLDKFSTLRMIYLENNELTELPEKLFPTLRNLEWLDVRNNRITTIPLTIKFHPCLETMLLQGNKIDTLPAELCTLPKLRNIQVANNPLATPTQDIVAAGSTSILNFLCTEWNKQHPEEAVEIVTEIQPKASTILCYRSPRSKNKTNSKKLSKPKDLTTSVRERGRLYKPSSRYGNASSNSADDKMLCQLCIENLANINLSREKSLSVEHDEESKRIGSMQLQELSPGSLYVRRNAVSQTTFIQTRDRARYLKLPALQEPAPKIPSHTLNTVQNEEKAFSIVTKDGRMFKLRPMKLNNSRCKSSGEDIAKNEQLFWISKLKELLTEQASEIQKYKDTSALKAWRHDRRSFNTSMEKAAKRDEDDVPFAIDVADYGVLSRLKLDNRSSKTRKGKSGFVPPSDINKRINEILEHLNKVQMASSSDGKTPRSQQMLIMKEIEKVLLLRSEVEDLRRYNDVTMALAK